MNDRVLTLLSTFGLMDRMVDAFEPEKIDKILKTPINWDDSVVKLQMLQSNAIDFFKSIK